ncbi:MAG: AAA family ATPase [Saprospiraceae bacterium]
MLIRFTVENFSSFKERQSFSLIPGRGTLKAEHKSKPINGISVLKTSVIFGANASGKSNLIKAMHFGKLMLIEGNLSGKRINYQKFRLDNEFQNRDTRLEYEFQHRGKNYAYGFVFNNDIIKEEWLFEITKKKDIKIFERDISKESIFDLEYLFNLNKNNEEKQFLNFTAKNTKQSIILK